MKTLYLECNMGAAGDMLTAALLELVPDRNKALGWLQNLGLPHVTVEAEDSQKCGIRGTHMRVRIGGEEEQSLDVAETPVSQHTADNSPHHHHHVHHHTSLADVENYIDNLTLPAQVDGNAVKNDIRNVYHLIAEAEGHAHGMPVDQIHFHEVGTIDAIFDVSAVCLLMHVLHPDRILASPIRTGFGEVQCAHGIMPVPTPATAYLLEGIPTYSGEIRGEMCTPTGAALLNYYVKKFQSQPVMRVEKIGYGMGSKDFPAANCVRAFLGESEEPSENDEAMEDRILELRANIDDMTGEEIGFATEKLFEAGARDVFTTPIAMKKNRPAVLLTVICLPSEKSEMVHTIFKYTTTIGIRETICRRNILKRIETIRQTSYGDVHVKESAGYGVRRDKLEYNDLRKIADHNQMSLTEVRNRINPEIQNHK